jgi:16S rRNA (cytidine1402-2'-O)-methyltransferase
MDGSDGNLPGGRLILVSTPIGNLGDMTYRGVEALKSASLILCEDTRHTRKLLTHYGINNRLAAYHDHNKERVTPGLVERMKNGEELALVSDAGTPGISDPGFYLARAAGAEGVAVTVVPGANAILPALLLSGFPTDAFIFQGFLPRKKGELDRRIAALEDEVRTTIFFVSPYKLIAALEALARRLPEREIAVVKEITKIHEQVLRGSPAQLKDHFAAKKIRGELVLVVKGRDKP